MTIDFSEILDFDITERTQILIEAMEEEASSERSALGEALFSAFGTVAKTQLSVERFHDLVRQMPMPKRERR